MHALMSTSAPNTTTVQSSPLVETLWPHPPAATREYATTLTFACN